MSTKGTNSESNAVTAAIDVIGSNESSAYFDTVIGHIEDIVMDEQFHCMQSAFFEKYYSQFEQSDENKHEYMHIFLQYTNIFERHLITQLEERMADFDLKRFAQELDKQGAFCDTTNYGEIYELLHSFTCFQVFKQLLLDYRSKKEGHVQHLDCFDILVTTPLKVTAALEQTNDSESNKNSI